ncbi:unnamed protein product [Nippostrongylus brasiliensis]|uniref:Chitin-binding type-2 domain-containing protein n=1 Tax=Nippostrongylus brasiliensis TaxID=27835 RepID=A0A0N4XYV6_NIPBR|nr:unnamed protein product [Nippostrongylus brasiliensis]
MDFCSCRIIVVACIVIVVETRYFTIVDGTDSGRTQKLYSDDVRHLAKRTKHIESDYIGFDQHGQAYVNCTYNIDGVTGIRKCSMPSNDEAFDMGYACFALWNSDGEIIAQDCWIHQEVRE